MKAYFCSLLFILLSSYGLGQETIAFPSLDGLSITADFYAAGEEAVPILLCHQARYSRGEYKETAKWLNKIGFTCLAIDQRSGDQVNGVVNETHKRAREKGLGTDYLDAIKDIEAGLEYLYRKSGSPVILLGSSYSASLVLDLAVENEKVRAVVSFSPGEYFGERLKLSEHIAGLEKPVFISSSRAEIPAVKKLYEQIPSHPKSVLFIPKSDGFHGSKALWTAKKGHEEYREALKLYLLQFN